MGNSGVQAAAMVEAHRLKLIFDSLREGVQVLGPDWTYLYVNEAVARHGRKARDELLGRTMLEVYPGIEQTELFELLERCLREGTTALVEHEFTYQDGQQAWFELRVQPCVEGLIILSLDISERKRLEHSLRQAEKLRALGQMAASVAHDLKNILNPIALNVELLRRRLEAPEPAAAALLGDIEGAVRVGADLVERMRNFSRQEPDGAAEPADLNRVAELAVHLCQPRLRELPGVSLRRDPGDVPPVLVRTSGLVAGMVNLVVNAIDALPTRGVITVQTGAADGGAWVEVVDDGPGMPPTVAQHVFEPFFTTKEQGTGLGLSTVYAYTQRHGGHLTLDTAPGQGTRVRLWFPAAPVAAPPPSPGPAAAARPPRRVLMAEDEACARAALEVLLGDDGFVVRAVPDGEAALGCLGAFAPDVLLVDLCMDGMDGATLVARARAGRPELPVVVMSGLDERTGGVAALLREPRTRHVPKPVEMDRLVAALDAVLTDPPTA